MPAPTQPRTSGTTRPRAMSRVEMTLSLKKACWSHSGTVHLCAGRVGRQRSSAQGGAAGAVLGDGRGREAELVDEALEGQRQRLAELELEDGLAVEHGAPAREGRRAPRRPQLAADGAVDRQAHRALGAGADEGGGLGRDGANGGQGAGGGALGG